ncbi:hypothetical protein [Methylobacterium nigriterrae]|uniref:hypothetical protein n=1 Tax=Methylobacterium nigriterrae TaxID=3127512 RepID=UPI003013B2FA
MSHDDPRRHTAIHEAGHATIGRALGLACGEASVIPSPEKGIMGHAFVFPAQRTVEAWAAQGRTRDIAEIHRARGVACAAGAEAEMALLGAVAEPDNADLVEIAYILVDDLHVHTSSILIRERQLRQMAQQLVRELRDAIERVADALIERQTLSGEEIDALVGADAGSRAMT